MGTIETTCAILGGLLRGATHDRRSLAHVHGMTVASADRYIRHLSTVPGVVIVKKGRRLLVSFSFGVALKGLGI
jgi:hypothetical protein